MDQPLNPDNTLQPEVLQASPQAAGERLDKYLSGERPRLSRTRIQKMIEAGRILVNGRTAAASLRLRGHEIIELRLPEEEESALIPEPIPLEILYEDAELAVVNKPAGMVVHAGAGLRSGTLVNALLYHLRNLSRGERGRPGIVHRLDKQTSGLIVVAKNDAIHRQISALFQARKVRKEYVALVHGNLEKDSGTIDFPIGRDRRHRVRMSTRSQHAREALTEYWVTERWAGFSLLRVVIKTGRTHQIRVHFSSIKHPIVGDTLYGAPGRIRIPGTSALVPTLERNFLHAGRLEFVHPSTGKKLSCLASLPRELQQFLTRLKGANQEHS